MANNLRPEATRGTFAAPQPIAVSRKQMFIPVHAKRGRFTPRIAPASRLGFASGDMRLFQRPPGCSRFAGRTGNHIKYRLIPIVC